MAPWWPQVAIMPWWEEKKIKHAGFLTPRQTMAKFWTKNKRGKRYKFNADDMFAHMSRFHVKNKRGNRWKNGEDVDVIHFSIIFRGVKRHQTPPTPDQCCRIMWYNVVKSNIGQGGRGDMINFDQFWKRERNLSSPPLFGGVRMLDFFVLPSWRIGCIDSPFLGWNWSISRRKRAWTCSICFQFVHSQEGNGHGCLAASHASNSSIYKTATSTDSLGPFSNTWSSRWLKIEKVMCT